MSDLTVANTIAEQLGGRQFMVMTGVKEFLGSDNALSFRIPKCDYLKDGISHCRIELTPMDVYTVTFYKWRGGHAVTVSEHENVYAEDLQDLFTEVTGLLTRFGRARR